jgi:hypothetical protein
MSRRPLGFNDYIVKKLAVPNVWSLSDLEDYLSIETSRRKVKCKLIKVNVTP